MSDLEDGRSSECKPVVECDEKYDHADHGLVIVTGIWKGVRQVDAARNTAETGVIIVRYSIDQEEQPTDELTDTLDEFLTAIDYDSKTPGC